MAREQPKLDERSAPNRLNPAPLGRYLVNILSIRAAKIQNTENNNYGDTYVRIMYRIFRGKPDNQETTVIPGDIYGLSLFKDGKGDKRGGKFNNDLALLYAACKSVDGEQVTADQICVLGKTRAESGDEYKFSIEELLNAGYVPKNILLLRRSSRASVKSDKDPFPLHEWSVPGPDTLAALEEAIARAKSQSEKKPAESDPPKSSKEEEF